MNLDIYMVGVGGQGVLTIAEMIINTAMKKGIRCNFFPTKGMAQRGGFVKAQLRLGDAKGPDISAGTADVVIAMEQSEALKAVDYLRPDGDMIIYGYKWQPTDVMLGRAPYPDAELVIAEAEKRTHNVTFVSPDQLSAGGADNIFLLGAAHRHSALNRLFTADELLEAIYARFPKATEKNGVSFREGESA